MKLLKPFILIVFTVVIFTSCSDYQKMLKTANYEEKFLFADREFHKEKYAEAIALYEQVYQRFPRGEKGEVSYYRIARSYFEQEDYIMGGYYFEQFPKRFPSSKNVENAMFYGALCSVRNSPKASLDQTDTKKALNKLQAFVLQFPNSKLIDSCNHIMDRMHLKLETKQFDAVELYHKMEKYRAAVVAAKTFLEEYPRSHFMQKATHYLYEDAYWLAMKSIYSKKKERIKDALDIYMKYQQYFVNKSDAKQALKRKEDLEKALILVDERYAFNEIVENYHQSNTSSRSKKIHYLEETIKSFNTFANQYPESDMLDKAKSYQKKATKELNNINKG